MSKPVKQEVLPDVRPAAAKRALRGSGGERARASIGTKRPRQAELLPSSAELALAFPRVDRGSGARPWAPSELHNLRGSADTRDARVTSQASPKRNKFWSVGRIRSVEAGNSNPERFEKQQFPLRLSSAFSGWPVGVEHRIPPITRSHMSRAKAAASALALAGSGATAVTDATEPSTRATRI